jgi:WD40 repeat protein
VVSVQGDDTKVLACYEDGTIRCWDVRSGAIVFDLQGRTSMISSVQFDATRLVADGTHNIIVTHDFGADAPLPGSGEGDTFNYTSGKEEEEEEEEDGGRPSATS